MSKNKHRWRILLSLLVASALFIFLGISFCSINIYRFATAVFKNDQQGYLKSYSQAGFCLDPFIPFKSLTGGLRNQKYLVLLQNNYELRPSGGFMGSYAVVNFGDWGFTDWRIENIYVPDGQVQGHVDPQIPIQQAFKTGDWRLHDSNWNVDFSQASHDIVWFFDKGGEKNIDGLIALNFGLIEKILPVIGEVYLPEYSQKINSQTIYNLTQSASEQQSFPGSIQKQTFLTALGKNLLKTINNLNLISKIKIVKIIISELRNGQILVWFKNNQLAKFIDKQGFNGSLGEYNYDYLYTIESNLGANKANCCIQRDIIQEVNINPQKSTTKITLTFNNDSQYSEPQPPNFWGGDYKNYQRLVIPFTAQNVRVKVNGKEFILDGLEKDNLNLPDPEEDFTFSITQQDKFKIVGFWVLAPAKTQITTEIFYDLPVQPTQKYYEVQVKVQPGINNLPYKLIINDILIIEKNLLRSLSFKMNLGVDPLSF